jgi:hypothetical protein
MFLQQKPFLVNDTSNNEVFGVLVVKGFLLEALKTKKAPCYDGQGAF